MLGSRRVVGVAGLGRVEELGEWRGLGSGVAVGEWRDWGIGGVGRVGGLVECEGWGRRQMWKTRI